MITDVPVISLHFIDNKLYCSSADGMVSVIDIPGKRFIQLAITEPISAFQIHPKHTDIVASGGDKRNLEVFQILSVFNNPRIIHRYKARRSSRKHWSNTGLVSHNAVWISDIQFLDIGRPSQDSWRIAVASRYGELFIYETSVSRRPIIQVLASHHPITSLWFGGNEHELIFTDTQFNVGKFDSVTGTFSHKFTGVPSSRILSMSASYLPTNTSNNGDFTVARSNENDITEGDDDDDDDDSDDIFTGIPSSEDPPSGSNRTFSRALSNPEIIFPIHGERVSSLRQARFTQGQNTIKTNDPSQTNLPNPVSYEMPFHPDISPINQEINTVSDEPVTSSALPDIFLATGGLDPCLRIYDWASNKLVSKINIGSKISKVLIVDPTPVEKEDVESVSIPKRQLFGDHNEASENHHPSQEAKRQKTNDGIN